jgi:RNA polymerase sporulation-specific sigma factor
MDTSTLPVMSEEEKMYFLQQMQNGDKKERENARTQLIGGNLRLVLSIVQRFSGRGENLDDLFQVGCIGLIKAIDHFDLKQEVRFSTYAVPMIIGEVRRFLRDYAPMRVSRSLKDLAYQSMQAKERLTASLGREPTILEISAELGLPKSDVVLALESIVNPLSLYEPVYSDGGEPIYVMDQIAGGSDDGDWVDEIAIKDALRGLSDREKQIIGLRFFEGKTQMEVSDRIGISQAQVSRLEKGALHKVQACLHE